MKGGETEASPTDWPRVGFEIPAQSFGPFDRDWLVRYAMVSGDDSPLHLDPNAARDAALPGVPVHGMLMFSCFEPFIMGWRPDCFITRLSGKFLRPLLVGEGIRIFGRVVRRQDVPRVELVLRLTARAPNDDLAILGEATVLPNRAGRPR
jgi:acyl dehydratase